MGNDFIDNAYKTGAGRYVQEPDALGLLGAEVALLGSKAYVVGGPHSLPLVREKVEASLGGASIPSVVREYARPPIRSTAKAMGEEARCEGCNVVVGIGGGRMMDVAKAVACSASLPLVEVPTSIATCAAYSPLSVMYDEDGGHDGTWRFTREIDAVIVDMDVMAAQPPRLIAAGVLDAMAKVLEIENGGVGLDCDTESVQRFAAYEYAKVNYRILRRYGKQAFDDALAGTVTEALERITFANIALTGIVSSLTRGFHQTAHAHELYNGIRTVYGEECAAWLHGELVAIGLIMQLVYNGATDHVDGLRTFMRSMGMPCTLAEVGIRADDGKFDALRDFVMLSDFVSDDQLGTERIAAAFEEIMS